MAFNDYVMLDNLKYKTLAKQWKPQTLKPATVRATLLGRMEATFGAANFQKWRGIIVGPVVAPEVGYGTVEDLRATIWARRLVPFVDHNGISYDVTILGPFEETNLVNVWNSSANKVYVSIEIISTTA